MDTLKSFGYNFEIVEISSKNIDIEKSSDSVSNFVSILKEKLKNLDWGKKYENNYYIY